MAPLIPPLIPPAVAVAPRLAPVAPTLLEDEDDFFLPMDNDDSSSAGSPEPQDPHMAAYDNLKQSSTSSSLVALEPIVEQPDSTDKAVAILEDFFFGKTLAEKVRRSSQNRVPSTIEVESSPTSVCYLPKCSCPAERKFLPTGLSSSLNSATTQDATQDVVGLCYSSERSDSTPAFNMRRTISSSSCSPKPVKPTLRVSGSSSSLNASKRNVSFTEISVREYDVELSDHPSCSYGPPIQLGWDYEEKEKMQLEDYEVTRSPRREVHELVLSYNARRRRLKDSGYKKKEIRAVEKEVERTKRERLVTEFFLPAMAIDETLEKVIGGLKQVFGRKQVCDLHP